VERDAPGGVEEGDDRLARSARKDAWSRGLWAHRQPGLHPRRGPGDEGRLLRHRRQAPLGNSQPVKTLDVLLEQSDFVTLHVPETAQTRGMVGAAQLARMKKGACLI